MKAQALILMGAPGAGKGTQARALSTRFGIPHISTGDILREAARKRTALGLAAQQKMDAGELVPDRVVCGLVRERISQADCRKGFILDGFPRTIGQARYLDKLLRLKQRANPLVLNLRVDHDLLIKRLSGRRTCPVCGEIYNMFFHPPKNDELCDRECARLIHRADDNEEAIRQRLVAYEQETKPLINYYQQRHLLHDVDGKGEPDALARQIGAFLKNS